jgi:hypothetical protein
MRVGPRVSLAARWTMLGQHHSLVLGFGNAPVRDQAAGIELNLDLVPGECKVLLVVFGVLWRKTRSLLARC